MANELLHRQKDKTLPNFDSAESLENDFVSFFSDKILTITQNFDAIDSSTLAPTNPDGISVLTSFQKITNKSLKEIIMSGKAKSCHLYLIPTSLVQQFVDILLPVIKHIVNLSLSTCKMPNCLKTATVTPLLRKHH